MSEDLQDEELTLFNIARGSVPEIFQEELQRVLDNVADINTDEKAKRQIVLKFTFKPAEDRHGMGIIVEASSKLAAVNAQTGYAFVGKRRGRVIALANDPVQRQFDFDQEDRPRSVSEAREKAAAGE